jgi:flagellar hook-length control protein FliK
MPSMPTATELAVADPALVTPAWLSRFAEAAPAAQPLTPASAAAWQVPDQIVRGLHMQVRDGIGEAVIRLTPEHLGEVVVEMKVQQDGVVAFLKADTPIVRAWIAGHRDDLERGLADAGLRLDRLVVSDRESGRDRDDGQAPGDERPRRRARHPSTGAPRFEIVV